MISAKIVLIIVLCATILPVCLLFGIASKKNEKRNRNER